MKTTYRRWQHTKQGLKPITVTRKAKNASRLNKRQETDIKTRFYSGLALLAFVFLLGGLSLWNDGQTRASENGASITQLPKEATESAELRTETSNANEVATISAEIVKDESYYIAEAVDKYLPKHKSEALMILHCLAHREARHGENKGYGDNGKAGGPFQFWQETWVRMRKQMLAQGHITEVGDRHNFRQSAHTTAWALANGRAKEWGPILRMSQGKSNEVCPVPSWNK